MLPHRPQPPDLQFLRAYKPSRGEARHVAGFERGVRDDSPGGTEAGDVELGVGDETGGFGGGGGGGEDPAGWGGKGVLVGWVGRRVGKGKGEGEEGKGGSQLG